MTDQTQKRASCAVTGCGRVTEARGWCAAHYTRWRRTGDPGPVPIRAQPKQSCAVTGCPRPYDARGLCHTHYIRLRQTGTTDPPDRSTRALICTVKGCTRPHHAHNLCHMHYERQHQTGTTDLKTPTRRTRNKRARQHTRDIQARSHSQQREPESATRTQSQQREPEPQRQDPYNKTSNNVEEQITPGHPDPVVILNPLETSPTKIKRPSC